MTSHVSPVAAMPAVKPARARTLIRVGELLGPDFFPLHEGPEGVPVPGMMIRLRYQVETSRWSGVRRLSDV